MSAAILSAFAVAGLLGWSIFLFNRLVHDRNLVRAGLSDIDVQLQRRHDLVPQLVAAVRGYATHERAVLEEVTALRARAADAMDVAERDRAESELASAIRRLVLLAEAYPVLEASGNFRQLMTELVETEDHLQHARRYYNGAVRRYNTRVQQFPDLLVARPFGFGEAGYFSAEIEARVAPRVERLAPGGGDSNKAE